MHETGNIPQPHPFPPISISTIGLAVAMIQRGPGKAKPSLVARAGNNLVCY